MAERGKTRSPDYKVVGMTWEILSERQQETANMTWSHTRTRIPRSWFRFNWIIYLGFKNGGSECVKGNHYTCASLNKDSSFVIFGFVCSLIAQKMNLEGQYPQFQKWKLNKNSLCLVQWGGHWSLAQAKWKPFLKGLTFKMGVMSLWSWRSFLTHSQ